jgi:hypothetical protein
MASPFRVREGLPDFFAQRESKAIARSFISA